MQLHSRKLRGDLHLLHDTAAQSLDICQVKQPHDIIRSTKEQGTVQRCLYQGQQRDECLVPEVLVLPQLRGVVHEVRDTEHAGRRALHGEYAGPIPILLLQPLHVFRHDAYLRVLEPPRQHRGAVGVPRTCVSLVERFEVFPFLVGAHLRVVFDQATGVTAVREQLFVVFVVHHVSEHGLQGGTDTRLPSQQRRQVRVFELHHGFEWNGHLEMLHGLRHPRRHAEPPTNQFTPLGALLYRLEEVR